MVPDRPNIVLILADDFGVGDIQALYPDNKIATPHLDQFVLESMHFNDAHSGSAVCSPTRYGLLTGRYAWRTPLQRAVLACYEPPLIEADRLTLPAYLQQKGYHTACIGKWHLGWDWPGEVSNRRQEAWNVLKRERWNFEDPIREGPTTRGFDYYFGTDVPNYAPFTYIEQDRVTALPTAAYVYDSTEGVVMPTEFIGAPMAPGWRFQEILPEITHRAVHYIRTHAGREQPFFLFFSMTSPHEPIVPTGRFAGKSGIAPIADFIMETDWAAGEVIRAVDEAGIRDNTLVIFTADNGHSHYTGWEELVAAGHMPSGPYRGHKGDIWEGGHRVPLLVRWPGVVPHGTTSDQLVCLTDIFATVVDFTGSSPLPKEVAEDSFSFRETMLEPDHVAPRKSIIHHSVNGEFAYREGPWKLIYRMPDRSREMSRGKKAVEELYNLQLDTAETTNVALQNPKVLKHLQTRLEKIVLRGTSISGSKQSNDVVVVYDTIPLSRWASAE